MADGVVGHLRLHLGSGPDVWPYDDAALSRRADLLCGTWDDAEDVLV